MTQEELTMVKTGAGQVACAVAGAGPPIMLLHGIPSSGYMWRNVAPRLADAFTVYVPDLLGYGRSDKPEEADLSVAAQARYMEAVMDRFGMTSVVLVGHDIGGGVCQILAARHPSKIRRYVLIDSIGYDSWPESTIARLKDPGWRDRIVKLDLARGFTKGLQAGVFHEDLVTDELVAAWAGPFSGAGGALAYLRAARALNGTDLVDRQEEIESYPGPVLVLWGRHDSFQPLEVGERLVRGLSNAHLEVLDEAGHWVTEDHPEEVARRIRTFAQPE